MAHNKIKIVFMGTPKFGAIILEGLIKGGYKPALVVTAPDKPVGRKQIITPPPVKLMAKKYNIEISQPEKIGEIKLEIQKLEPDLIIVASYGQILPQEILDIPKYGSLNVHASLLPKYRGPSPIQYAILNNEKETGVTIILMDAQIDHGPIISQRKTIIEPKETAKELEERLAILGRELLLDTLPDWIVKKIQIRPQNEKEATYTKILKKEDGKIDWQKSAKEIECQIRAFNPWPGSITFWEKDKIKEKKLIQLKVLKARVLERNDVEVYPVGKTLVAPQNELCVQCGKDFLIIERLQPEGKREMASEEFIRGHPDFIGTILQ